MVPPTNLLAFCLVAIPLILVPGPSVLFVIGRSLSLGRLGGLLSVIGNAIGAIVVVLAVAFGVGIIVAQSVVIFTIVKVIGAAYLIYLGVQAIRHRKERSDAATRARDPARPGGCCCRGSSWACRTRRRSCSSSRCCRSSWTTRRGRYRFRCSNSVRSSWRSRW